MKKLDKYIIGQFLSNFLLSIFAFIIIFLLVDLIDRLDKFIDTEMPNNDIFNYYMLTIPWFISISMPMGLLLSTVFTIKECTISPDGWLAIPKAPGTLTKHCPS